MKRISQSIPPFVTRQWTQIQERGLEELWRKLKVAVRLLIRLASFIVLFVPVFLAVVIIRLVRPYCLFRLQRIIGWRLGHFAGNIEMYLCEQDAGINRPQGRYVDIWYPLIKPCNTQLDRMWRRVIHIGPGFFLEWVDLLNNFLPGGKVHRIGENTSRDRDVHNLLDRFPAHLRFLPEEEKLGETGLRALGIPAGALFVCLNVRDAAYLSDQSPHINWSYHNYRDCNVQNYVLAAQKLADRGYYVVRMGAVVKEAMNVSHPMIIDYAANGMRSDFMDIYLGAKCTFCISNGTGFDAVPYIFRRPIVYVDHVPIGIINTSSSKVLVTIKKHWLRGQKRFMTFREIFESGVGYALKSCEYESRDIELIESSPEEIAAVALEIEERLRDAWVSEEGDEELQRRFWEIFPKTEWHGEIRSRIGADFLRRHKEWLI